jgi:hypothetical protein
MVVEKKVRAFIASRQKSKWLEWRFGHIYVRNSVRCADGYVFPALDVASIEVNEDCQGKGNFTRWLTRVEILCEQEDLSIYVENVMSDRFNKFFIKRGYAPYPLHPNCYVKMATNYKRHPMCRTY